MNVTMQKIAIIIFSFSILGLYFFLLIFIQSLNVCLFIGWRLRKRYFLVKDKDQPKEKQVLSWVSFILTHTNTDQKLFFFFVYSCSVNPVLCSLNLFNSHYYVTLKHSRSCLLYPTTLCLAAQRT